ncbi:hypothetical protein MFLAVUS_004848 [Mucor flavus]|uniref:C2 domain-containing protein n=1 Tax=Mucor flavus TaxID=439312 RepID=A0ABP9YX31_9FUNG
MPAGKLSVSPLTIHGLDQNGFPNSHTFIGCYVSQSEKQRTNSAPGPQPQFKDTLSYNVTETSETLFLDVINEDPSHPGVIGSGQLSLKSVLDTGKFEDWVPLQSSTGGHLGHLFMKLSFSPSGQEPNPYGVPSPTSTPTPSSDTRDVSTLETSGQPAPAYNPNASLSTLEISGQPAPAYNPNANLSTLETSGVPQPAYGGAASSFSPSTPVAGTPPVATEPVKKPKKEVPEWMKYGGAALAGAAAVGLGSWAVNALGSDEEEEEEEAKQKAHEAQQQQQSMMSEGAYAPPPQNAYDQPQESYGSRNFSGPDDAEVARREEEERYENRRREENERYEDRRREEEERYEQRRKEEEAALQEAVDAAEEAADRAEEAAEEAEEAAEDAEEAAEEAEEAAEDAEEAAEEAEEAAEDAEEAAEEAEEAAEESGSSSDEEEEEEERRVPNDCKWR